VAIQSADLTNFVLSNAVKAARDVIDRVERAKLSARDRLRVLASSENPPAPNRKLQAAARALPRLP